MSQRKIPISQVNYLEPGRCGNCARRITAVNHGATFEVVGEKAEIKTAKDWIKEHGYGKYHSFNVVTSLSKEDKKAAHIRYGGFGKKTGKKSGVIANWHYITGDDAKLVAELFQKSDELTLKMDFVYEGKAEVKTNPFCLGAFEMLVIDTKKGTFTAKRYAGVRDKSSKEDGKCPNHKYLDTDKMTLKDANILDAELKFDGEITLKDKNNAFEVKDENWKEFKLANKDLLKQVFLGGGDTKTEEKKEEEEPKEEKKEEEKEKEEEEKKDEDDDEEEKDDDDKKEEEEKDEE